MMIFPRIENHNGTVIADYFYLDKTNNGLKESSPAYINQSQFDLVDKDPKNWSMIKFDGNYFLYKRVSSNLNR